MVKQKFWFSNQFTSVHRQFYSRLHLSLFSCDVELTTLNLVDPFVQRTISQTGNKKLDEVELLTQTGNIESHLLFDYLAIFFLNVIHSDLTIVVVSILFIVLLAIVNLILFAVRRWAIINMRFSFLYKIRWSHSSRHRHRLRGRHLLSSSFPSLFNDRTLTDGSNHGPNGGPHDASHHLMDGTTNNNNNNNDILPAVGTYLINWYSARTVSDDFYGSRWNCSMGRKRSRWLYDR